jgi:hypothetical protein
VTEFKRELNKSKDKLRQNLEELDDESQESTEDVDASLKEFHKEEVDQLFENPVNDLLN